MEQSHLTNSPSFDGITYSPDLDQSRLTSQLERVKSLMADNQWRTLSEIASSVCGSEAGCSARLRDLRKAKFGGMKIERKRMGQSGLWSYRLISEPLFDEKGQGILCA